MARNGKRPLSPHLGIWRWGPHMLVSILHRVAGTGLAIGGGIMFAWWLAAAATGPDAYATFLDWATPEFAVGWGLIPLLVLVGLTWAFFQHMSSGLRHFVLDTGAGYELATNRNWSRVIVVAPALLTLLFWVLIWSKH